MATLALPRIFRNRINRWVEGKNPPSREAIHLHNRRLYILPTRFGYLFAVMLLFLFLAAINYQNSMAFVLTFMLTALAIISLWYTHKNLLGIEVKLQTPRPVHCGQAVEFNFEINHPNNARRYAIGIQYAKETPVYFGLKPQQSSTAVLKIRARQRGQFKPQGVTVFTRYPTGLFHAWGWLRFDQPVLVYPGPENQLKLQQTMIEQYDGKTSTSTIEGDDFAGLREHREGESLRHISWKAYAQGKGLLTKTFQGHSRSSLWIDWQQIDEVSVELRLSIMTALVLDAENDDQKYGLKLPGVTIEQNHGSQHKHNCLQALALFKQENPNAPFNQESDDG